MTEQSYHEQNLKKVLELLPEYQWAAQMAIIDCDRLGHRIRVSEVYRPQARQDALYAQGRTKKGPVVTWTRKSKHTERKAMDVYCLNCTYSDIVPIFAKYGIVRDPVLIKLGDFGHFDCDNAKKKPTPNIPKTKKAAERLVNRIKPESRAKRLKERLQSK
jgi:peptidoglycan L-alanyl-D-glutamate endopeptidase CwlK